MVKLEIGPGNKKIDESWVTVGPFKTEVVDIIAKWELEGSLPFSDESIDLVYASHVLEHVWWYHTVDALKEVYRILKIGGVFEVHVPDFKKIVEMYLRKQCGDSWRKYNPEGDYMLWVNGRIFTYGGPGNTHRAVFDRDHLYNCLVKAGFTNITNGAPIRGNDHGFINLSMTAVK